MCNFQPGTSVKTNPAKPVALSSLFLWAFLAVMQSSPIPAHCCRLPAEPQVCQDGSIQFQASSGCSPARILLPGVGPAHLQLGYISLWHQHCLLQSPRFFYASNHQPRPFQPCLMWKCHVWSPGCKENIISWVSLLDFSVFYHLTAALAKLPVCASLHWKRTNPHFWSQSFQFSTAAELTLTPLVWLFFQELFKREMRWFFHRHFLQFFSFVLSLTCFFYSVFNLLSLWTQLQKRERSCRAYVQVFLVFLIHVSSCLTEWLWSGSCLCESSDYYHLCGSKL